ncbi:MAG TPA: hypothetical protein VGN36_04800, partial [Sphingorhabdus sp.]|nr:hypothetical protein [Sphingorhabdus sp.]
MSATAAPALAQRLPASPPLEIVVNGQRLTLGQPERVLTEDEVALYGLSSIGELVDEIADERGDRREDIVYLVNGQRVSGLGDIETYPTEAINSIEVLPIGAAGRVGGGVGRKVVNISLKDQVRTYVGRAALGFATDGDFTSHNGDISVTDIAQPRRINLSLRWRVEDPLLESDREIVQAAAAPPDLGRFRTLRPKVDELELRASLADRLGPDLTGLVTARLFDGHSRSFLGLDTGGNRLDQNSRFSSANLDMQLNADIGEWLLVLNGAYGVNRRSTSTGNDIGSTITTSGTSRTRAISQNASAEASLTGSLLELPAGPLSLTLRGRLSHDWIRSGSSEFDQWNREIGAAVQVPIAGGALSLLDGFGELTAGLEWSHRRSTRVGTFTNMTYSLQWQPVPALRLAGSINTGRTPPSVELLSAPLLATPGVRYLDPLRSETIDVIELSGGNPALAALRGNNRSISAQLTPFKSLPLMVSADYSSSRNRDVITALPPGTSLLLLAFSDRFQRDASGRLIQVDARPVNFARLTEEQLRYGF